MERAHQHWAGKCQNMRNYAKKCDYAKIGGNMRKNADRNNFPEPKKYAVECWQNSETFAEILRKCGEMRKM